MAGAGGSDGTEGARNTGWYVTEAFWLNTPNGCSREKGGSAPGRLEGAPPPEEVAENDAFSRFSTRCDCGLTAGSENAGLGKYSSLPASGVLGDCCANSILRWQKRSRASRRRAGVRKSYAAFDYRSLHHAAWQWFDSRGGLFMEPLAQHGSAPHVNIAPC